MRAIVFILIFIGSAEWGRAQHAPVFQSWAATPPMGWNSYDAYYGTVTEKQFLKEVDVMAEKLLPVGYEYAVLDYCWFNPGPKGWDPDHWITYDVNNPYTNTDHALFQGMTMDANGRLLPSPNRFPSAKGNNGFKKIGDYVHAKGMKFGIHVMRGIPREAVIKNCPVKGTSYTAKEIANLQDTCLWNETMYGVDAGKPGAQAYYNSLLDLYAAWGVDFIKVDDIASPVYHAAEIKMLRKAIDQCGRKIVLSLSPGDAVIGYANEMDSKTNLYRVSNDVWDRWRDILHVFDLLNEWSLFIGQGSWPDADMIPFGRLCLTGYPEAHGHPNHGKREHDSFLSYEEQKTMFTLWCMARSPLMWGGAPSLSKDSVFQILGNKELLHINQNSIHNHQLYQPNGRSDNKDFRIWVAESADQKIKYVAFFNLQEHPADLEYKLRWEFWKGNYTATDLWNHQVIRNISDSLIARNIPPHGVVVYKLTL
jgi:alpha-galactosidase